MNEQLRGLSPLRIALMVAEHTARQLSPAQRAILGAFGGDKLSEHEVDAFRKVTHSRMKFGKPRAGGYAELWLQAGRRSGKTTTIAAPIAVSQALSHFEHRLAPGEEGRVVAVAPKQEETRQLSSAILGICKVLGIVHQARGSEIAIGRALVTVVTADAHAGRSGTVLCGIVDEAALLDTREDADAYDVEVIAAIRAGMANVADIARLVVISSAWRADGEHYRTVQKHLGKVRSHVLAAHARTEWLNPAVTPAVQERLEPDPRRREREFGAVPGTSDTALFDRATVRACVDRGVEYRKPIRGRIYRAVADMSGGRNDNAVCMVGHVEMRSRTNMPPHRVDVVDYVRTFRPGFDWGHVLGEIAATAKRFNDATVLHDPYGAAAFASDMSVRGVRTQEVSFSRSNQLLMFTNLAAKLRAADVRLLDHEDTIRELLLLQEKRHSGGGITFEVPQKRGHDDHCDALAMLCSALNDVTPSGGDIRNQVDVRFDLESRSVEVQSRWFRVVKGRGGIDIALPVEPPAGTYDYEAARERRRAMGMQTLSDERERREAEREGSINVPVDADDAPPPAPRLSPSEEYLRWARAHGHLPPDPDTNNGN